MHDRATPNFETAARTLRVFALAALVLYAGYSAFGLGGDGLTTLFEDWVYNGILAAGAALALLRAATVAQDRAAWAVLGLGLAAWVAGEIVYTVDPDSLFDGPFPATSDMLWLAFYPAAFVALVLLVRSRARVFYASVWIDGLLGALALAALVAQFVFPPIVAITGAPGSSVVADLIYPLGDALLLVFVVGALALTGWRPGRRLGLVAAGFALGAVADGWSLYWSATGHDPISALDGLWPASALLLGWAAWARPSRESHVQLAGRRLLVMPVLFAAVAVALLAVNGFDQIHAVAYALAVVTLAGAVARMAFTFVENMRLAEASRAEALTDALTGLANRRSLMIDLEAAVAAADGRSRMLVTFDLNGFKRYNDTFGHPAGDLLLSEIGMRLDAAVAGTGTAYRLGGDEFCVLYEPGAVASDVAIAAARAALSDRGKGVQVTAAYGTVDLANEATHVSAALQLADERMYSHKRSLREVRDRDVDYSAVQLPASLTSEDEVVA